MHVVICNQFLYHIWQMKFTAEYNKYSNEELFNIKVIIFHILSLNIIFMLHKMEVHSVCTYFNQYISHSNGYYFTADILWVGNV